MKVPLGWLKEYVDITLPAAELADRLTMAGIETGVTRTVGGGWEQVFVGQIVAVNPHPNADRLHLPTVDLGTEQMTVVCGAPNLRVGDKVAFAHVGAELIDGHGDGGQTIRLKPARIRGVESRGMVCSEKELGISDEHEGIMVLPPEAPVGAPLADYLGDTILDLDVTPNRPDCLSVIGIAREVAALTGQSTHLPEVSYEEAGSPISEKIAIEIADPDLCSRYSASLITGIKIAGSPPWMQQRLLSCGMRPISNIVDVTNYVMLEYGQPLHAFDHDKIEGRKIIVRRAEEGETLVSLDGVERTLSRDMLVIADGGRAVAIAGVMGGANTEVTEETTSILLESANFNAASIHHTGRQLSLPSEACMRFERGIRPEMTVLALKRATQLMLQLAGGEAARGFADAYSIKQDRQPIPLAVSQLNRLLGVEFAPDLIVKTLTSLGFDCEPGSSASEIRVTAPYWRNDISQTVDLIEEVARIAGYDRIPTTMLSHAPPQQNPAPIIGLKRKIRNILVGYGFQEIVTYSLTGLEMLHRLTPEKSPPGPASLRLVNPMTAEQEYLRPSLRANLLATLSANRKHEDDGIRLFELGKVYLPQEKDLPAEPEILCGLLSGSRLEKSWHGDGGTLDFFDAKGAVEGLLKHLNIEGSFEKSDDAGLHPARQAAIVTGGNRLGVVGELHPKVTEAFDISEPACLFEIDVTSLAPLTVTHKMFQPVPRFPPTVRDIALVVDASIKHQQALDIIQSFPLVSQVTLFDVYSGKQVPQGKKSLAYRITYQSPAHTLTDREVDKVQQQILSKLSGELGATLRG